MLPGGKDRGANVALSAVFVDGEPQTIGPQEPSSMPPHELEQLFLA